MSATHITHIIDHLGAGGAQRLVADLAPRQLQRGHHVTVVSMRGPTELSTQIAAAGVQVHSLGLPKWSPLQLLHLARLLRTIRPDVVHTHLTASNLIGRVTAGTLGVPAVLVHDHEASSEIYTNPAPLLAVRRLCETRLPPQNVRYIVISRSAATYAREVRRWPVAQTTLVPNGINVAWLGSDPLSHTEARLALGLPPAPPLLAFIGRLHPQKRVDVLLNALALLEPRVHLAIAGDGPCAAELRTLARHLGIEARVHFLGFLQDVRPVLWAADIYVHPTVSESFGLAVGEASACGLPVVASGIDGLRDVVRDGETGLLVEPGRPAAFATAITRLLTNPQLARRLGVAGQHYIHEQFAIERVIDRLDQVYAEVQGDSLPARTGGPHRYRSVL